jgi:hypothetical protein
LSADKKLIFGSTTPKPVLDGVLHYWEEYKPNKRPAKGHNLDLLEPALFYRLHTRPDSLRELVPDIAGYIVVEEVQNLSTPSDTAQREIVRYNHTRFSLTGSLAQK